jgi:polygalacturonase
MPQIVNYLAIAALAACAAATPVAEPAITAAPSLEKRATCTFSGSNGAASASASQKSCATIVLSNVAVPSGVPLDLSNLNDGTHVRSFDTPISPLLAHGLIVFALGYL